MGIEPPTHWIFKIFFKKIFFIQTPTVSWLTKKVDRKKMHFPSRNTHFTILRENHIFKLFLTISWYFEIVRLWFTPKNTSKMLKHVKGYFLSGTQKFSQNNFLMRFSLLKIEMKISWNSNIVRKKSSTNFLNSPHQKTLWKKI